MPEYSEIARNLCQEIGYHGANGYQLTAMQKLRELVSNMEIRLDERRIMCDEKEATIERLQRDVAQLRSELFQSDAAEEES